MILVVGMRMRLCMRVTMNGREWVTVASGRLVCGCGCVSL